MANHLPIAFSNKKIYDYNYFLFQQLHWFNTSQVNFDLTDRKLFENYESAIISKDLRKINAQNFKVKRGLVNFKKNFIKNFDKNLKNFYEFNLFVIKILGKKNSLKTKIENIMKSKYFKKYSGIGTVYLALKKK